MFSAQTGARNAARGFGRRDLMRLVPATWKGVAVNVNGIRKFPVR